MKQALSRIKSRRGYILLPVVLLLGLLALVAFLLGHEGGIGRYLTLQRAEPEKALYLAEAGLQQATWQVQQANCVNYTDVPATPFGAGSFSAVISPHYGSPVAITATGVLAGGTSRSLGKKVPALQTPITEVLQPDGATMQDTWIYQWKPTWNYGVDTQIGVDTYYANSDGRSLLKFDLSSYPSSIRILSATLELYMNSPSDNGGPVSIHRVTTDWDEGNKSGGMGLGATWNVSASGVPWTIAGGDFDPDPVTITDVTPYTPGWSSWNITDLVSDWVTGISPNHGLMLRMQQLGRAAYFHSSDYSNPALRPKLTITYACECGSGTVEVLPLQPGAEGMDSYVQKRPNDSENGLQEDLFIESAEGASNAKHVLLNFDLSSIPAGSIISSAELSLSAFDVDTLAGGADVTAHRLLEPWVEAEVTYQDADSTTAWTWPANFDAAPAATVTLFKDNLGWYTWNLTDLVTQWFTGIHPNNGLVLLGTSNLYWSAFHSSDFADPALRPKLVINYSCPCGVDCSGGTPGPATKVLFVVPDPAALSVKDQARQSLMESWGFTVTTIAETASQAEFDAAAAAADVAYITEEVLSGNLGTKLTGATIGIVNEEGGSNDELGMASSQTATSAADLGIIDNSHYITSPFAVGTLTIFPSSQGVAGLSGTLAPDLQTLATWPGSLDALAVVEAGANLVGGGPAAGRRVKLPWGSTGAFDFESLNPDGQTIMRRAIEWGAGITGTGPGPTTVTLNSIADTWLDQNNNSTNYGSDALMQSGKDAGQKIFRPLLEFDISSLPAGATVVSATLRLYVENNFGQKDKQIALHRITAAWNENTVTWNSVGGGIFDPTQMAPTTFDKTTGWKEWVVPPGLLHEWIDGASLNYGLLLDYISTDKNNYFKFATKEHTDPTLRPQLVIEYTAP
jgi:hypothetical protein